MVIGISDISIVAALMLRTVSGFVFCPSERNIRYVTIAVRPHFRRVMARFAATAPVFLYRRWFVVSVKPEKIFWYLPSILLIMFFPGVVRTAATAMAVAAVVSRVSIIACFVSMNMKKPVNASAHSVITVVILSMIATAIAWPVVRCFLERYTNVNSPTFPGIISPNAQLVM